MSEQNNAPVQSAKGQGLAPCCPLCGTAVAGNQRFCGACGAKLVQICKECHAENPLAHQFCGGCGARLDIETAPAASQGQPPAPPTPREERRWATLLFADLADFTGMSESMDPEDVKTLAHRCAQRLSEEIGRFGGTVIAIAGDQVVAAFGAPLAHEDDAERAVRAGLAMRDCPLTNNAGKPIRVHVGINTGDVMAGLIGPQERRDYAVMGDTTNVAARLMSAAPLGCVLVGEETWRATRRVVRYRELPPVMIKGKERPLPVWEALEAAPLSAARPLGTAPFLGRDDELGLLSGIWLKVVRESRPHLVTVLGEPGIGKSRLVAEFERQVMRDALVVHGRCLPYGEALGYGALAAALKEAAGITAEDDAPAARARLDALSTKALKNDAESDRVMATRHLALLSGLEDTGEPAGGGADQRTLHSSVRYFLEGLALSKPLCVVFEDIHWADHALLDLIEFVASRAKDAPLLIVAQSRPELLDKRPNWGGGVRAHTSLSLEALNEQAGRELIEALCRERSLPDSIVAQVGRGSYGNPLFAEELVSMIVDGGTGTGVPLAIKALIAARLDTLPAEQRHALQIAAVFGKSVWEGGLRALGLAGDLTTQLEALEQKDLLRAQTRSQFRGEREYIFKHDLIRDVAYETLPRAERKNLHGQIADWLERAAGEKVEAFFDQLAHHALQAGQEERAVSYLVEAARRARRLAAHREEAALLLRAIELAARLGQEELKADLLAKRGRALVEIGCWNEARTDLEAALPRIPEHRTERRAEILVDLARACTWQMDGAASHEHATKALALAETCNREALAADAVASLAISEHLRGNLLVARDIWTEALRRAGGMCVPTLAYAPHTLYILGQYEKAIELAREAAQAFRGKNSFAVMQALPHLGLNLAATGRYNEAAQVFEEARRYGREYESWSLLARSISMSSGFHLDLFDFNGAERLAEEARELGSSANFPAAVVSAGVDLLFNFVRRGELGRVEGLFHEVQSAAESNLNWHRWLWRIRLAQGWAEFVLARGDYGEALRCADAAIDQSRNKGRVKYEVLGLVTRARCLHALGRTHEAIVDLRHAIDLARPLGDPAMFLQAGTALLAIDGDDVLLTEARAAVEQITKELTNPELRRRFEEAEPARLVSRLSTSR